MKNLTGDVKKSSLHFTFIHCKLFLCSAEWSITFAILFTTIREQKIQDLNNLYRKSVVPQDWIDKFSSEYTKTMNVE